jgi:hydrogenase nickel incorporation protein HypA/HybF
MHEISVCQALVQQVLSLMQAHGARGAAAIHLLIGPLSGVEAELLRGAFALTAAGTGLEGARLVIEAPALRVACATCGAETEAAPNRLLCGACGDWHTHLVSGDELTLASVDLVVGEVEEPHV